jgi:hypothetical protein
MESSVASATEGIPRPLYALERDLPPDNVGAKAPEDGASKHSYVDLNERELVVVAKNTTQPLTAIVMPYLKEGLNSRAACEAVMLCKSRIKLSTA